MLRSRYTSFPERNGQQNDKTEPSTKSFASRTYIRKTLISKDFVRIYIDENEEFNLDSEIVNETIVKLV